MQEKIVIRKAKVNNLKNLSLEIPRDSLVVVTGLSGSGKSSLAFDTLYAEGQRRFSESLSSYARQFLGRMSKPDVEDIDGIPPAIAIEQKVSTRNPRSTVATTTEIYDYLRVVFAKAGHTFSPISGREVKRDTAASVMNYIESQRGDLYLLAELHWATREDKTELLLDLVSEGYSRLYVDGRPKRIEDVLQEGEPYPQSVYLLVDRVRVESDSLDEDTRVRVLSSIEDAFSRGRGDMAIASSSELRTFCERFELDGIVFPQSDEYLFSFNSPLGACPVCGGLGKTMGVSEDLVVPDKSKSLYDGAIACWRGEKMSWFRDRLISCAGRYGIPIFEPYCKLSDKVRDIIWNARSTDGDESTLIGINEFFEWVETQKYKIQFHYMLTRFSGKAVCHSCGGTRLRKEALWVKLSGRTIADVLAMNVDQALDFFDNLNLSPSEQTVIAEPLSEIVSRLKCIKDVGLGYLCLNRACNTLSGGESQRISLVSALGSNLVGSMYILDEPSIGLHPRDTQRLIAVLKRLRDIGNSVIVVEHDEEIIRAADMLIDLGPKAGEQGGELVFQGKISGGGISGLQQASGSGETFSGLRVDCGSGEYGSLSLAAGVSSGQTKAEKLRDRQAASGSAGTFSGLRVDCGSGETFSGLQAASGSANDNESIGECGVVDNSAPSAEDIAKSLTLQYLYGVRKRYSRQKRSWQYSIMVRGAMEHNLKSIDVRFPLGVLCVVTGVSGSGKSSLVGDILYPALFRHINSDGDLPGAFLSLEGNLDRISKVEYIDQNPIGRSSRSNAVTYLKAYDDIRKLLSDQQYARINGFTASHFSFNTDGGRCPECQGEGIVRIQMQFISDVTMVCEECGGKRFKSEILEVRYRGKNIDDILNLSVDEAISFFSEGTEPEAHSVVQKLLSLQEVGLGYIKLGQSSSTLSGGESQRVKLAYFLSNSRNTKKKEKILFIFDEPTTGLHFYDVEKLLRAFDALLESGHSIVVVEHNQDVIKASDWVIDLGPDAGDAGGELVFTGTPEEMMATCNSHTAQFLRNL